VTWQELCPIANEIFLQYDATFRELARGVDAPLSIEDQIAAYERAE